MQRRSSQSESGDFASPRSSRAASFSSERSPLTGALLLPMPLDVFPPPAYVAVSAASQIASDYHNAQLRDQYDLGDGSSSPFEDVAIFSEDGLSLINSFLDNVLYSILAVAKSSSINAIRPAVVDILRPKLAREAMAQAEQELQDLLAGDEEEDQNEVFSYSDENGAEKWDINRVWRRTRLRLMVYTRLGEMEDEDEEHHVQQLGSEFSTGTSELTRTAQAGLVSWSSAIFLTSVIEHVAEQALVAAGQTAFSRAHSKKRKSTGDGTAEAPTSSDGERVTVAESDVEKIALNSTLGRLWRTWRKRARAPGSPHSRHHSRSEFGSIAHSKSFDRGSVFSNDTHAHKFDDVPENEPSETDIAANIPLPMSDNDVNEIEVPGLAREFDEEGTTGTRTPIEQPRKRPASVLLLGSPRLHDGPEKRARPLSMPPPERFDFLAQLDRDVPAASAPETEDTALLEQKHDHEQPEAAPTESEDSQNVPGAFPETPAVETPEPGASTVPSAPEDILEEPEVLSKEATPQSQTFLRDSEDEDEVEKEHKEPHTKAAIIAGAAAIPAAAAAAAAAVSSKTDRGEPQNVVEAKSIDTEDPVKVAATLPPEVAGNALQSPPTPPPRRVRPMQSEEQVPKKQESSEAIGIARTSDVPVAAPPTPERSHRRKITAERIRSQEIPAAAGSVAKDAQAMPQQDMPSTPSKPVVAKDEQTPVTYSVSNIQREEAQETRSRTPPSQATVPPLVNGSGNHHDSVGNPKPVASNKHLEPMTASPERKKTTGRTSDASSKSRPNRSASTDSNGFPHPKYKPGDSPGTERAQLQRISSSSDGQRSVHSANTSILNSARVSESSMGRPKGLSIGRMSEEDREREFDSLVRGDETVKYTLTPQSMRDLDAPTRTSATKVTMRSSTDAHSKAMPLRSTSLNKRAYEAAAVSSPRPEPTNTTPRKNGPSAREPRVQTESMRDFADFIRSTGPQKGQDQPRPINPNLGSISRKTSTRSQGTVQSKRGDDITSSVTSNSRVRKNLEPRSPAHTGAGSSDLIDFIRQGPPAAKGGEHRIARTVAPFRTTMDSDQFETMFADRSPDGTPTESKFGSTGSNPSTLRGSVNSRTGLIPPANVSQPAYSNKPQTLVNNGFDDEPVITKTRRRIKDPYAIDDSDEDEDLLTALPKSKPPQQESLMDFLNSAPPPSNTGPQPLSLSSSTVNAARQRNAAFAKSVNGANGSSDNTTGPVKPAGNKKFPQMAARDARSDRENGYSGTNDLADFLRSSGPSQPQVVTPILTGARKEEKSGVIRPFWKRKKSIQELS